MKDNFERTQIEKIVEFILYGEDSNIEINKSKNLEQRLYLAEQIHNDYLRSQIQDEEIYLNMNTLLCDILDCYFALGIKAGAKLCIELLQ
jgi:hypothetical protein